MIHNQNEYIKIYLNNHQIELEKGGKASLF